MRFCMGKLNEKQILENIIKTYSICFYIMFKELLKYGKLYTTAQTRYPNGGQVICDSCNKEINDSCYGYKDEDLCILCYRRLSSRISSGNPPPMTRMINDMYRSFPITKMMNDMYNVELSSKIRQIGENLRNLYNFPGFDRKISTVKTMLGEKNWQEFMNAVIKDNKFSKLDVDIIYAIKRLFTPLIPEKYRPYCDMRLSETDNAIKYRVNESKNGFLLFIQTQNIGEIIYNQECNFQYIEPSIIPREPSGPSYIRESMTLMELDFFQPTYTTNMEHGMFKVPPK